MLSAQVIFARIRSSTATTKAVAAITYAKALAVITLGRYLSWITLADTATAQDSGTLYSQNYCSYNYFASDYVGEIRTF
tara:strand:- start:408 stop:644 length:237 start_codon:yes stop_codon:yes gene_type:complete